MNGKLLRCVAEGSGLFRILAFVNAFEIRVNVIVAVELVMLGGNRALGEPAVNLGLVGGVAATAHCLQTQADNLIFCVGKVQVCGAVYEPVDFAGCRKLAGGYQYRLVAWKKGQQIFCSGVFFLKVSEGAQGLGAFLRAERRAFFYAAFEFFAGGVFVALLKEAQADKVVGIVPEFFLTFGLRRGITGQSAD